MTKDNSPYFLRLELIKIAKDILLEDYQNSKLAKENDYYAQREINDRVRGCQLLRSQISRLQ